MDREGRRWQIKKSVCPNFQSLYEKMDKAKSSPSHTLTYA